MGFNPTRRYRDGRLIDVAILVAGSLIILGLVAWGFGLIG